MNRLRSMPGHSAAKSIRGMTCAWIGPFGCSWWIGAPCVPSDPPAGARLRSLSRCRVERSQSFACTFRRVAWAGSLGGSSFSSSMVESLRRGREGRTRTTRPACKPPNSPAAPPRGVTRNPFSFPYPANSDYPSRIRPVSFATSRQKRGSISAPSSGMEWSEIDCRKLPAGRAWRRASIGKYTRSSE